MDLQSKHGETQNDKQRDGRRDRRIHTFCSVRQSWFLNLVSNRPINSILVELNLCSAGRKAVLSYCSIGTVLIHFEIYGRTHRHQKEKRTFYVLIQDGKGAGWMDGFIHSFREDLYSAPWRHLLRVVLSLTPAPVFRGCEDNIEDGSGLSTVAMRDI